jgi:hypothetical protein
MVLAPGWQWRLGEGGPLGTTIAVVIAWLVAFRIHSYLEKLYPRSFTGFCDFKQAEANRLSAIFRDRAALNPIVV